jgi:hypothetical protein
LLLTSVNQEGTVKIRLAIVCFIFFIAAGLSPAQTATPAQPPHGLVTLKLTLSKVAVYSPPPASLGQDDVSGPPRRDNPQADPVDQLRKPSPLPNNPLPKQGKQPDVYVYSLEVKNVGEKKVLGVSWEYVAADRASGAELNRRPFASIQAISPSKVATLSGRHPSPPTNIVTASGLGKDELTPFTSSAEFRCVLYADGTVWQASGADKECAELRRAEAEAPVQKRKP